MLSLLVAIVGISNQKRANAKESEQEKSKRQESEHTEMQNKLSHDIF